MTNLPLPLFFKEPLSFKGGKGRGKEESLFLQFYPQTLFLLLSLLEGKYQIFEVVVELEFGKGKREKKWDIWDTE